MSSPTLAIGTYDNRVSFRPGEKVEGKAMWILEKDPESVEIRLIWYTSGKGTQDVEIVATRALPAPGRHSEAEFSFTLPAAPYSFSGKLISLIWALELVVLPSNQAQRLNITVSPTGTEVILGKT
jgi:hypothetical protein